MVQLYRWFQEHASIFRHTTSKHGGNRTMRRKVTVEREERTLLVSSAFSQGLDVCPLCGQELLKETVRGSKTQQKSGGTNFGLPDEVERSRGNDLS
jgi:hypothetical protein